MFSGIIIMVYLLFYSTKIASVQLTEKKQVSVNNRPVTKKDKYTETKTFFLKAEKQELEALYKLGDSASPFDIRRIDFYERGGLISSTPEIAGLSKGAVESIRRRFHQMEMRGYYNVELVNDLNENASLIQKLKGFFKAIGASNYHDGLQRVNEHLSFSSTDLNNSLFADIPRLASETYGSVSFGRWSAIKHIFEDPEFGIIRLNEEQAGPAGKTVHVLPVELNEEINGNPANYTVEVASNGSVLTTLRWVNGKNMYSLYMQRNTGIDNEAKTYFFELARSLPDPEND